MGKLTSVNSWSALKSEISREVPPRKLTCMCLAGSLTALAGYEGMARMKLHWLDHPAAMLSGLGLPASALCFLDQSLIWTTGAPI